MPEQLFITPMLFDPNSGQFFLQMDKLRGMIGTGAVLVPPGAAGVKLITVPTGKKFVMTDMNIIPIGLGIVGNYSIFDGGIAGQLMTLRETVVGLLGSSFSGFTENGIVGKTFTTDVHVVTTAAAGAIFELGGYFLDLDPEP